MKRSNAVKQLKYWLFGASDDHFHKEEAERLLEKIEKMGFLPPAVWFDHGNEDKELANRWEKE
jgi:hypothetical protein